MIIEIDNCVDCPFSNNDNERGINACNLAKVVGVNIQLKEWEQLPEDKRHKDCPIKKEVLVKLK